jgi:hypothetical protein
MTEEEKEYRKIDKPTYIMIPRKMVITWVTATITLFLLNMASFQYTNYVDRRSNGFWCGIVVLFDDTYKVTPPPTDVGIKLMTEFREMRNDFHCK